MLKKIDRSKFHQSQRGIFFGELYNQMIDNKDIYMLTADLGWGMLDRIREDFPDRFMTVGAAEFSMMGIACGLALEGRIPVVYSITPFLLYRPFEIIRTYINWEKIPVKMVGGGRAKDYKMDGISHWSEDDRAIMSNFENIISLWPLTKKEINEKAVEMFINSPKPVYLNLCR